jgi:hypothetical protein
LLANEYTKQLVNGRPEGKFPPLEDIKRWIIEKGIQSEIPISSLAFIIARKISEEGTKYYKQGGTDLVDAIVTPERIQSIIDKVGVSLTNSFASVLVNELKAVA